MNLRMPQAYYIITFFGEISRTNVDTFKICKASNPDDILYEDNRPSKCQGVGSGVLPRAVPTTHLTPSYGQPTILH